MEVKNFREKIILDAVVIFLVGFVSEIIMLKMTVWGIVKVVEGYIEWVVIVVIIVLILKYGLVSKKVKIGESLVYVGYGFIPVLLGEIINEVLGLYRPNILGEVVTMAGIETYLNLGIYYWIYFLIRNYD